MPREILVPEASASLTSPQPSPGPTVTSQIEFSSQLSFEMNAWCSEKQEIDNHDFLLLLLRSSLSCDMWGLGSAEVLVHFQLLALSKVTLLIGCLGIRLHLERWKSRVSPSRDKPLGTVELLQIFVAQSISFSAGICQLALAKIKFPTLILPHPST